MSRDVTYPGVYVEEVPGRPAPIAGVPTSIMAFVGRARLGPTDEPVMVAGFADFERLFGGLWQESTLGYAVQQYFANGGAKAIIVRVLGVSADPVAELSGDATARTGLHAVCGRHRPEPKQRCSRYRVVGQRPAGNADAG